MNEIITEIINGINRREKKKRETINSSHTELFIMISAYNNRNE